MYDDKFYEVLTAAYLKQTAWIRLRLVSTLEAASFHTKLMYFTPNFIPVFNLIERVVMPLPMIGAFFRYQTCTSAIKPG